MVSIGNELKVIGFSGVRGRSCRNVYTRTRVPGVLEAVYVYDRQGGEFFIEFGVFLRSPVWLTDGTFDSCVGDDWFEVARCLLYRHGIREFSDGTESAWSQSSEKDVLLSIAAIDAASCKYTSIDDLIALADHGFFVGSSKPRDLLVKAVASDHLNRKNDAAEFIMQWLSGQERWGQYSKYKEAADRLRART